jgi:hypothetical protein
MFACKVTVPCLDNQMYAFRVNFGHASGSDGAAATLYNSNIQDNAFDVLPTLLHPGFTGTVRYGGMVYRGSSAQIL